jgi:hypothetical protein
MNKHVLLFAMISCYLVPIFIVCTEPQKFTSISEIICDDKCKYIIFTAMIAMGVLSLLYEYQRKDAVSFYAILFLLANIYCLIFVNEKVQMHYLFAFLAFVSILFFMIWHCKQQNNIIKFMLALQLVFFAVTCISNCYNYDIFIFEVLFLANFALYYLYLHYIFT